MLMMSGRPFSDRTALRISTAGCQQPTRRQPNDDIPAAALHVEEAPFKQLRLDLHNIARQSYDYQSYDRLTSYDGRLIYKASYDYRKINSR